MWTRLKVRYAEETLSQARPCGKGRKLNRNRSRGGWVRNSKRIPCGARGIHQEQVSETARLSTTTSVERKKKKK